MNVQDLYSTRSERTSLTNRVEEITSNNRIILHEQESLSEIYSIKNMNIIIAMGRIAMQLDDQAERVYSPGSVIDIPSRTKIRIKNLSLYKTAMLVMAL